MNIAICDDETIWLNSSEKLLQKWAAERSEYIKISTFQSAESFWFKYNKNEFDILLLDIQMSGENGIELARLLRKNKDDISIIFVTAISDYISEGYDVSAVHYLIKPIDEAKLFGALDKALNEKKVKREKLLLKGESADVVLCIDDICYIEARAHDSVINAGGENVIIKQSYGELIKSLPTSCFVQCHRSYTINLNFVKSVKKFETVLDNNLRIPISRRMYSQFSMAFISYYKSINN